ncbi:amidohydrolase [Xanthomonas citri pv. glycines]|uniref:Amidohydrolase n=2 Tax=Xanthomonas TaxID=338 RepID=A0AAX0I272_XANCG|nr:amidohydrolase [Xanthomonas citri pv. glycines str. 8ra]ARV23397.1 amidohydrolase [Xanthomonas citri pv. glycines str. 12-2]OEY90715.1 amidohydrolase [Xanthomonas citri pv. glycines]OOX05595.1 amidohydrolase [Xanthomonas citri pv. glycines]QDR45524.1 amidohydrolase [Xanthomonas citri pv. glycines]
MSRMPGKHDAGRRLWMQGAAAGLALGALPAASSASGKSSMVDLVVRNARITTLDPRQPNATAIAVADGRIVAVGDDAQIMALAKGARTIDAQGRRLLPGLNDSHTHLIRGGLNYNLELRWDSVRSLADAMAMLKAQVDRTPAPQWVRVVGGFTAYQFAEKRLPTLEEINAIAPETPVFLLHLYDRALLNRAALRACGYDKTTPDPPGGRIERDKLGNPTGLLLAKPNALILYASLAKGPRLPLEYQANSTRHFMRELNRLGVTSVIDAGGGFQNYPEDYQVIEQLHAADQLSVRIAYNLFTQNKGMEVEDFRGWTEVLPLRKGDDLLRHNGAGEMLVFSAADFEQFSEPRPELPAELEPELEQVVRLLVEKRWPFRIHATYDESIARILDVYEKVNADIPFDGLHWFIDHAETITPRNIERIRALNGGIAVQHRMAYQGEAFVRRYGVQAARQTPPVRRMLAAGIPVGAGTDATRVASYNPWVALSWLVTGRTVGGLALYGDENLLDREQALRLWTQGSAWFSGDETNKGTLAAGQLADFIVLSDDYFRIDDAAISDITSVLTVLGGRVVHGEGDFAALAPTLPPAMPDWSPVNRFGGYQVGGGVSGLAAAPHAHARGHACRAHGAHAHAGLHAVPTDDLRRFWGALGCACFAF